MHHMDTLLKRINNTNSTNWIAIVSANGTEYISTNILHTHTFMVIHNVNSTNDSQQIVLSVVIHYCGTKQY